MAFAERTAVFFNTTNGIAVAGTWKGTTAVKVIFDADYVEPFDTQSQGPRALGALGDFPGVAVNQTLLVNGTTYTIQVIKPDGVGLVALHLRKS